MTKGNDDESASRPVKDQTGFFLRAVKSPEHRQRIVAVLFPDSKDAHHWWFRFSVMMGLSVMIAVMGLSLNSVAVVIGAMLIAPLMTPVLGISAAIVMGWFGRLRNAVVLVALGSIGSVAISWAVTSVLPSSDRILTAEVLSRTSPDLRDLIVALAAGAAGAYATSRQDISSSLPGVAVAVALVPPLSVVGFALSIGRNDLARGALLLYVVNLFAIILVGAGVFLASGFVPRGRLRTASKRIRIGVAVVTLALVAVAVPLTSASIRSAGRAQVSQTVNQTIVTWLIPYPSLTVDAVTIAGVDVRVQLSGPVAPPPTAELIGLLKGVVGPDVAVRVVWFQTSK